MNEAPEPLHVAGARVARLEDRRLIAGEGRFAADWNLPGQLHAAFLRSDRAHARIVRIDASAARAAPGVRLVLTGEDAVRAGQVRPIHFLTFPGRDGMRARIPDRPSIAHERVRFVGEPVALVVADSADLAADACALVRVPTVNAVAAMTPPATAAAIGLIALLLRKQSAIRGPKPRANSPDRTKL